MLEIVAVLFSLLSVLMTKQKKWICWPIGIVGIITYGFLFFKNELFWQFALQGIFLVQSIIGWRYWKRQTQERFQTKPMTVNDWYEFIFITFSIVFLTYYYPLSTLVRLDVITSALSLYANFLLIKKKTSAWVVWILVDAIMVYMFLGKDLFLSAALYILFLMIACLSFYDWSFKGNKRPSTI